MYTRVKLTAHDSFRDFEDPNCRDARAHDLREEKHRVSRGFSITNDESMWTELKSKTCV